MLLKVVEGLEPKQLIDFLLLIVLPLLVSRGHEPRRALLHGHVCEYATSCSVLSRLLLFFGR